MFIIELNTFKETVIHKIYMIETKKEKKDWIAKRTLYLININKNNFSNNNNNKKKKTKKTFLTTTYYEENGQ